MRQYYNDTHMTKNRKYRKLPVKPGNRLFSLFPSITLPETTGAISSVIVEKGKSLILKKSAIFYRKIAIPGSYVT